jgi:hypothetical protein
MDSVAWYMWTTCYLSWTLKVGFYFVENNGSRRDYITLNTDRWHDYEFELVEEMAVCYCNTLVATM